MLTEFKQYCQRVLSLLPIIALNWLPLSGAAQHKLPDQGINMSPAGFSIKCLDDRYVIANWTIKPGQSDVQYALERSSDGVSFETLEQVDSRIAGTENFQYAYFDEHPNAIASYYRLRITTGEKAVTYSLPARIIKETAGYGALPEVRTQQEPVMASMQTGKPVPAIQQQTP